MKNNLIRKFFHFKTFNKTNNLKIKINKVHIFVLNNTFCTNLKITSDIVKNKKEIYSISNHIDMLNLPNNKLLKKADLEILKKNFINVIQTDKIDAEKKSTKERELISLEFLIINYENYSKFIEISRNSYNNPDINKIGQRKIEIIKKDDRLIINLNDLTHKNTYLGVILNKKIRAENPDKVNNLNFFITL